MSGAIAVSSWYVTYIWRDSRDQLHESYVSKPLDLDLDEANDLYQFIQNLSQETGHSVLIRDWKRLKGTLSLS